ncbi:MAG: acylneuraminate cytidylyltransferase [Candidatus Paceibacterota bacterium]
MLVEKYTNVAFIPVRGGSKSIPGKNIKMLAGKPLLCHTVDAALSASSINKVVVSTESEEIRKVVRRYYGDDNKLLLFDRSIETTTDTATSESAMLDFAKRYQEEFDHIVLIQATSPLLESYQLEEGLIKYFENKLGGLVSVVSQKRFMWDEKNPLNYKPQDRPRRQDFQGFFVENGAFYITSKSRLLETGCRVSEPYGIYVMPEESYYEIDEPEDWDVVESLVKRSQLQHKLNKIPKPLRAVVFDFDGVFTDNKVIVFQNGEEAIICDRGDGMGIELLKKAGIPVWVLSKEKNPVLKARCNKLKIPCIHGVDNKWPLLQSQLKKKEIDPLNVIYVGNDVNDIECLMNVGCGIAPSDAHPKIKSIVDIILSNFGGDGAIREIAELILEKY